jgi:transposase InsO family protein
VDFQFDATTDGRPIKIVSIIDEHTRECLGGLVERSVTADRLINELDRLAMQRGYPAVLRCDNGPELACDAMADWAGERVGLSFIPPGQPWRNGYVESFNSRVRDECLNIHHLLVTGPGPGRDHRLETGLQPPATALRAGLPSPSPLRCRLHPPMNDSQFAWISSRGPASPPSHHRRSAHAAEPQHVSEPFRAVWLRTSWRIGAEAQGLRLPVDLRLILDTPGF